VQEKRRHARVQTSLEVSCNMTAYSAVRGSITDLSIGGAFIECEEPIPFGTELSITVRLPGGREDSRIPAVVRWVRPGGVGVQFGLLGARETHLLTDLLRQGKPRP
jgi:Tfp pilus assembly protein PilZ